MASLSFESHSNLDKKMGSGLGGGGHTTAYAAAYCELLLKGCLLYPSFLEVMRDSNTLVW